MGQQQLFLIVLGVIIVGIALMVGISLAASSSDQSNKDAVMYDLLQLSSMARAHFYRPVSQGGGGYSFADFRIPEALGQAENGTIEHINTGHKPDHIHFIATGKAIGENGVDPIRIEIRMTNIETKMTKHN